jgi:hypothetical protein
MRNLINILAEADAPIKKEIVAQVKQTHDINVLNRVLNVLRAGNLDEKISAVLSQDADAANFLETVADVILKINAPIEEKDAFLNRFPKGIINTSLLLDGGLHSYLDIVNGDNFARTVLATLAAHRTLIPQGVGPGEIALAILSPQIKWSGRIKGGGDIIVGKTAIEVKTTLESGGRWVNARKADQDMASIKNAILDAFRQINTNPPAIPPRLNPNIWVDQIRPRLALAGKPNVLKRCVGIMAKGLFAHANTSDYESALLNGTAADISASILKTGFENYKNYSNFDGILMMNNNSESVQYFTSYESMQGLIKSDVAYIMAPDSEGMPKVDLIAVASTGVDVKALRKAERAAAKASAQPAAAQPVLDPDNTRLQVTRKGRQAEPRDKDTTPRQRRDK